MGKAVITENIGAGLYKIRRLYNLAPLEKELKDIADLEADYYDLLLDALDSVRELRQARDDAKVALDDVVRQWQEALISAAQPDPPPFPQPPGPETTPDDGQADDLFAAINAARGDAGSDALTRKTALDSAAKLLLAALAGTGRTTDMRSSPAQRAVQAGYTYDAAVGVGQALAFGATTPERAIEQWRRNPNTLARVLSDDYTECGVAARYARGNPYGYLWCVFLSAPGSSAAYRPRTTPDPAAEAGEQSNEELQKIKPPTLDNMQPKQLGEVMSVYGQAAAAFNRAEDVLARLQIEHEERLRRKARLLAIKAEIETPVFAWCCIYADDIDIGTTVATAEVPGYDDRAMTPRVTVIDDVSVSYAERNINVIPGTPAGQLRDAETLADGRAFVNLALEPGHLKWRPLWRYGTLTASSGAVWSVSLPVLRARDERSVAADNRLALDAAEHRTLTGVPVMAECAGSFAVGDEVLLTYLDRDRARPVIIGWRREPKDCNGRQSWAQIR